MTIQSQNVSTYRKSRLKRYCQKVFSFQSLLTCAYLVACIALALFSLYNCNEGYSSKAVVSDKNSLSSTTASNKITKGLPKYDCCLDSKNYWLTIIVIIFDLIIFTILTVITSLVLKSKKRYRDSEIIKKSPKCFKVFLPSLLCITICCSVFFIIWLTKSCLFSTLDPDAYIICMADFVTLVFFIITVIIFILTLVKMVCKKRNSRNEVIE